VDWYHVSTKKEIVTMMVEFIQAVVTQGWLWTALLILLLLFALDKKCPWPLRSRLEVICATSSAVGLMFVGILLLVSLPLADMVAIDPMVFAP
jgi:hypothetical protein